MTGSFGRHVRNNAVGYVALFVALSGAAYATHENIRSSDIVNNQVKSIDVRNDNLAGGGLTGADIDETTLRVLRSTRVKEISGTGNLEPDCRAGEVATGGGFTHVNSNVLQFRPKQVSGVPTGWSVALSNNADEYEAYVICAKK